MDDKKRSQACESKKKKTAALRLEMMRTYLAGLMDDDNYQKLAHCSPQVIGPIFNGAIRMDPASIFINTGSDKDIDYIRQMALSKKEESPLAIKRHTYHFDGPNDQGRDTANTKYLAHSDTEISSLQQKEEHRTGILEVRLTTEKGPALVGPCR